MVTKRTRSPDTLPISKGYEEFVSDAQAEISTFTIEDAIKKLTDEDAVFVDVRDGEELKEEGKIPGAIHASRGMLEFYVDPDSPFYMSEFSPGKDFLLYCGAGWRSALSTQRLQEMGIETVADIDGGFEAWKEAGGPIEKE